MLKSEITGTTFVHAREGQYGVMYSLQLSKKSKDDQWENGYINAQFKKDAEVPDGAKIDIKSGWLSFYKTKDNRYAHYIFVNEFEILEYASVRTEDMQVVDKPSDLPF